MVKAETKAKELSVCTAPYFMKFDVLVKENMCLQEFW